MTEPQEVLKNAALDVMGEAGSELQRRGWPVELLVDYVAVKDTYAVSLRFELPHITIPIEPTAASSQASPLEPPDSSRGSSEIGRIRAEVAENLKDSFWWVDGIRVEAADRFVWLDMQVLLNEIDRLEKS